MTLCKFHGTVAMKTFFWRLNIFSAKKHLLWLSLLFFSVKVGPKWLFDCKRLPTPALATMIIREHVVR